MSFPPLRPPGALSLGVFLAVVAAVSAFAVWAAGASRASEGPEAVARGRRRGLLWIGGWLALTAVVPATGVLRLALPAMLALILGSLVAAVGLALSAEGRRWAEGLPLWALIGFQGFRLPLEWVLHRWYLEGTVPVEMTWEGSNLDVISGVVCLLAGLALACWPSRGLAWVANGVGFVLLLNVMRVAVLSTAIPLPMSFGADPPLVLGAYAPYAWIVSICVAGALVGHLVTFRKLLGR